MLEFGMILYPSQGIKLIDCDLLPQIRQNVY